MSAIAFVFPGQGSQSVGMLKDLAEAYPLVKETFDEASATFGMDLWALAQEGPESVINQTEITQPLMLVAGVACWRAWTSCSSVRPAVLAGHSLGEYSAYVAAGTLAFTDAVRIVKLRGELMRDACPGGAGRMAAVLGLDDEIMKTVCLQAAQDQVVQAVNFNAPGQIVIAGHVDAVDRAITLAKTAGAKKAMPLPVSVPCHSDLMRPASEKLAEAICLTPFAAPLIPVVNNVDAAIELDPALIKQKLVTQLYSPVLWVDSVNRLQASVIVECGPGKVLSGLSKRIARDASLFSLQDPDAFAAARETLG